MAAAMREAGFIGSDSADDLFEALRAESRGQPVYSMFNDQARSWEASRAAAMGDAPGAQSVPKKVTLREFDALRKSIGNEQRAAEVDPGRATEALALTKMKSAMDDRINEVVRGDGAIDENLPIEWANALTDAQALKRAQVDKFRTGPQASAFVRGSDNLPKVQGGEFAAKVWGSRPGVANDVREFKKILDDDPALAKQFRGMVTTEAAGTATNAGNLTGKFVRWVDNSLPGLKESFSPQQVTLFRRMAADIKRAEAGLAAGIARGSPTYQNASNALELGLLDSPVVNALANRIPGVRAVSGPALDMLRGSAKKGQAEMMANLLASPREASNALGGLFQPRRAPVNPLIAQALARGVVLSGAGQ